MKSWWKQPELRIDEVSEAERHATWLELFFDLIFVVAIAQLAHNLNQDISLSGFLGFVVLFVPVWWAWVGATFYANRFDTDDLCHRLLTAIQIVAVAALAVNIHDGLGKTSASFALSYASVRAVLVVEYLHASRSVAAVRRLDYRFQPMVGLLRQPRRLGNPGRLYVPQPQNLSDLALHAPTASH